jgi:hypothetical protein
MDSPSARMMKTSGASQSRETLFATTSNTGARSVGELEITRRISAVAVCCSSDSESSKFRACSSFEDAFDRDHRLVGESRQ